VKAKKEEPKSEVGATPLDRLKELEEREILMKYYEA
jgi:hypothetical protein